MEEELEILINPNGLLRINDTDLFLSASEGIYVLRSAVDIWQKSLHIFYDTEYFLKRDIKRIFSLTGELEHSERKYGKSFSIAIHLPDNTKFHSWTY